MDRAKLNKYIKDLMSNLSDQGKVSEILTNIVNENNTTETTLADVTKTNEELTSYNQSLIKVNNKIMVQLGDQNGGTDEEENQIPPQEEPKDKYEELPDLEDLLKEE